MKKLKHLLETLGLLAIVLLCAVFPVKAVAAVVLPVSLAGIALLLLAIGYLLWRHPKRFLALLLVALAFCPLEADAQRASRTDEQITQDMRSRINELGEDICTQAETFDKKGDIQPAPEDVNNAYIIRDLYEQLGLSWLGSLGTSEAKYDGCAKDFLSNVASWKQRNQLSLMRTVPSILRQEKDKCWPCGIAVLVIAAIEEMVSATEETLRNFALMLLGTMFLLWLAVWFMKHAALAMEDKKSSEALTLLWVRTIVVICCAVILQMPIKEFFNETLSPFIETNALLSQHYTTFRDSSGSSISGGGGDSSISDRVGGDNISCSCCPTESGPGSGDCNGGSSSVARVPILDDKARSALLCMTCTVYKQTAPMVAAGQVLTSQAIADMRRGVPRPLDMYLIGLLVIIVFTLLCFLVAFQLIDIFLRLGFVFILTPLLITAFAFPISREYAKRGWEFFVHAMLNFLALAIGMCLVLAVFTQLLPGGGNELVDAMMAARTSKYSENLYKVLSGESGGTAFSFVIMLVAVGLFGKNVLQSMTKSNKGDGIVEMLSGVAVDLPSISGAAVLGSIQKVISGAQMIATAKGGKGGKGGGKGSSGK